MTLGVTKWISVNFRLLAESVFFLNFLGPVRYQEIHSVLLLMLGWIGSQELMEFGCPHEALMLLKSQQQLQRWGQRQGCQST